MRFSLKLFSVAQKKADQQEYRVYCARRDKRLESDRAGLLTDALPSILSHVGNNKWPL